MVIALFASVWAQEKNLYHSPLSVSKFRLFCHIDKSCVGVCTS